MSEKNAVIKKMIEEMVQKEVRRLLPEAVKQVMSGMINEAVVNLPQARPAVPNNSSKRRALQEGSGMDYEEYPTMPVRMNPTMPPAMNRMQMAAQMGFEPLGMDMGNMGGGFTSAPAHHGMITAPAITEHGTAVNVEIPDHVLDAFNTDYRGFLKAMDKHKTHG